MKYIIVQDGGSEIPIVFSELLIHADIGWRFQGRIISAGFVQTGTTKVQYGGLWCHGKSETLKKESRGEIDTQLVYNLLFPKRY